MFDDPALRSAELAQDSFDASLRAREHRRIAQRVLLASGMTEAADQVDELLVVNAVAVAGVGADALERREVLMCLSIIPWRDEARGCTKRAS